MGVKKGTAQLLQDVSFDLRCGQITAIIGINGAGKTTLLRAMLGELRHSGTVRFQSHGGDSLDKVSVGYVPQRLDFDRSAPLTVLDFLLAGGGRPLGLLSATRRGAALEGLRQNDCLPLADRRLGALSGGELQRVLLTKALLPVPDLLLLDEPVSGLDRNGLVHFYDQIDALRKAAPLAIAVVSHDLDLISLYADHMVLLGGTVLAEGTPGAVRASAAFESAFPHR